MRSEPPRAPSAASPPLAVRKGRGAVGNPQGRFERNAREPFDDGWSTPGAPEPPAPVHTVVTEEHARTILTRNASPDVPFDLSLNPYRGCEHGCIYCYARPNHGYVGLSPGIDFETRLFAKINAVERLRAELAAPSYRCQPVAVGTATDAYQPIERDYRLTRGVLQLLSDCHHPVSIVTKSALIERDIDLLASMARRRLAAVHLTITTLDPVLARRWEPRAAAPWRRLETIRRLAEAGIPVGVSVAPVAPFLNEPELERVLSEARAAGATHGFYLLLRLPWELKDLFGDWLRAHYPDRAQRVLNRLREMRAHDGETGRLNDPRFFARMKGRGNWAELVRLRFDVVARKLGLNRGDFDLRCDLFRPPAAADSAGQLALFGEQAPDEQAPDEPAPDEQAPDEPAPGAPVSGEPAPGEPVPR